MASICTAYPSDCGVSMRMYCKDTISTDIMQTYPTASDICVTFTYLCDFFPLSIEYIGPCIASVYHTFMKEYHGSKITSLKTDVYIRMCLHLHSHSLKHTHPSQFSSISLLE